MEISKWVILRLMSEVSIETEEKICEIYDTTHGDKCRVNWIAKLKVKRYSPNKPDILMPSDLYWYDKMDAMIERLMKEDERYDLVKWERKNPITNG